MYRSSLLVMCACGRLGFDGVNPKHGGDDDVDAPRLAVDAPKLALDAGECPPGYTSSTGCYRVAANTGWLAAELACEADAVGAHLIVLDDALELARVTAAFGFAASTWIGTSKRQVAAYRTVIDTAPFLDLGVQTEPSEECLSIDPSDDHMYLHTCGDMRRNICEYDGIAAVPSAY